MKKVRKHLVITLAVLLGLLIVFAIGFKLYTNRYYKADTKTIDVYKEWYGETVHEYTNEYGSVFIPANEENKAVIVFYPGGKVEYTAYSGLMYELASRGYLCLLPEMPENLAFLRINAAKILTSDRQKELSMVEEKNWYLAGHSLGGVAAATYLSETQDYRGLIMCASYTTTDFSKSDIRLLSIYGDRDGVLNMRKYKKSKALWPEDSKEAVIQGGIHSFFGCYGVQSGDGKPFISNYQQIQQTADIIQQWLEEK